MFAKPRQKKTLVAPPKKRKAVHTVEEITFDNDARADYLTGFHKRKQQKIKNAQERAAVRARQERIETRKQIREDRKKEVEDHVEKVNSMLREAQRAGQDDSDAEDGWGGFADAPAAQAAEPIDLEAEYIDEDKFTTVTIESVSIDRDGLHKPEAESESDDDGSDADGEDRRSSRKQAEEEEESTSKSDKSRPKKKRKKTFRYESKAERRVTRRKERASKR